MARIGDEGGVVIGEKSLRFPIQRRDVRYRGKFLNGGIFDELVKNVFVEGGLSINDASFCGSGCRAAPVRRVQPADYQGDGDKPFDSRAEEGASLFTKGSGRILNSGGIHGV